MQKPRQLLIAVGTATLIVLSGVAVPISILARLNRTVRQNELIVAITVVLPISVAVWLFRRQISRFGLTQREVRSIAIAYAATCPIWLVMSLIVAEIPSSFVPESFGRYFVLAVAYSATALAMAALSYATCLFVLWLMRRESEMSPQESSKS